MSTLLLIRHGRTSANTAGVLAGRSPGVELDAKGHEQVAALGRRLTGVPLKAIASSPLKRCRQTAQAVAAATNNPVTTEQGLVECGYGDWTGRKISDLAKEKLWSTVQAQPSAVRFPNGESMTEMYARAVGSVRAWDAKLTAEHGAEAVWAAVSHGDVIKAILADALGLHLDGFQRIMVDPASVSVIRYTGTRPYVISMNTTAGELAPMFATPPKKPRSKRSGTRPADDPGAVVGGGLGSADAVEPRR